MGEVYRARDARLGRVVAIKVIGATHGNHPEMRRRFQAEARLAAQLDHPRIGAIFDVGHEDGVDFFVMEFIEGRTLADRIAGKPLPFAELIGYAIEIAAGLAYAHGRGVEHHDLKPANVLLTSSGVKVIDFGLAKLRQSERRPSDRIAAMKTLPLRTIETGVVPGTAEYLPPELLQGQPGDHRSDIFTFGVVLYEMAAGRPAFDGPTPADLMAAILTADPPPLAGLEPALADVDWVIRRCLRKVPNDRWQSMADVEAVLKRIATTSRAQPGNERAVDPLAPGRTGLREGGARGVLVPALALALGLAAGAAWTVSWRSRASTPMGPVTFSVYAPQDGSFTPTEGARQTAQLAVAPDGRSVAFVAAGPDGVSRVWLRTLDAVAARPLQGTEEASYPFWSPDSKSLAFFADGYVRRIDLAGGPPRVLAAAAHGRGGAWSVDGQILFSPATSGPIQRVGANGGSPVDATRLANDRGETSHRWPVFLPDGRRFLYYANGSAEAHEGIYLASLDNPQAKFVFNTHYGAAFLPPNRVLFLADETLVARAFDVDRGEVVGDPVLLAEHVGGSSNFYGAFSVSRDGVIAFARAPATSDLVWVDRDGRTLENASSARQHADFRLSPDGRLLAASEVEASSGQSDIYVLDFARGTRERATSARRDDGSPVWAPDAKRLVFSSNRQIVHDLFMKEMFGTSPEQPLYTSRTAKYPTSWSRDGQWIAFHTTNEDTRWDVAVVRTTGGAAPSVSMLMRSPFNERQAQFSPDGAWVAYTSDESKRDEVYVQSFQNRPERRQMSVNGGHDPHWRADGGELFYASLDGYLMAVALRQSLPATQGDRPHRLFRLDDSSAARPPYLSGYDVSPDGRRFLVRTANQDARSLPLTVILNRSPAAH